MFKCGNVISRHISSGLLIRMEVTIKNTVIVVAGHMVAIFSGTHIETVEEDVEPSKLSAFPDPRAHSWPVLSTS